jgi:REJ domain
LDQQIQTTSNEIYIPPKLLIYGLYKLKLTVNIIASSSLISSASIDVKIVRSEKLIVNLIKFGTSVITLGQNQELLLEPEKYSVDGDGNKLIANVSIRISF